jgi:hypothetical protein
MHVEFAQRFRTTLLIAFPDSATKAAEEVERDMRTVFWCVCSNFFIRFVCSFCLVVLVFSRSSLPVCSFRRLVSHSFNLPIRATEDDICEFFEANAGMEAGSNIDVFVLLLLRLMNSFLSRRRSRRYAIDHRSTHAKIKGNYNSLVD